MSSSSPFIMVGMVEQRVNEFDHKGNSKDFISFTPATTTTTTATATATTNDSTEQAQGGFDYLAGSDAHDVSSLSEAERGFWQQLVESNIRASTMASRWCLRTQLVKKTALAFHRWKLATLLARWEHTQTLTQTHTQSHTYPQAHTVPHSLTQPLTPHTPSLTISRTQNESTHRQRETPSASPCDASEGSLSLSVTHPQSTVGRALDRAIAVINHYKTSSEGENEEQEEGSEREKESEREEIKQARNNFPHTDNNPNAAFNSNNVDNYSLTESALFQSIAQRTALSLDSISNARAHTRAAPELLELSQTLLAQDKDSETKRQILLQLSSDIIDRHVFDTDNDSQRERDRDRELLPSHAHTRPNAHRQDPGDDSENFHLYPPAPPHSHMRQNERDRERHPAAPLRTRQGSQQQQQQMHTSQYLHTQQPARASHTQPQTRTQSVGSYTAQYLAALQHSSQQPLRQSAVQPRTQPSRLSPSRSLAPRPQREEDFKFLRFRHGRGGDYVKDLVAPAQTQSLKAKAPQGSQYNTQYSTPHTAQYNTPYDVRGRSAEDKKRPTPTGSGRRGASRSREPVARPSSSQGHTQTVRTPSAVMRPENRSMRRSDSPQDMNIPRYLISTNASRKKVSSPGEMEREIAQFTESLPRGHALTHTHAHSLTRTPAQVARAPSSTHAQTRSQGHARASTHTNAQRGTASAPSSSSSFYELRDFPSFHDDFMSPGPFEYDPHVHSHAHSHALTHTLKSTNANTNTRTAQRASSPAALAAARAQRARRAITPTHVRATTTNTHTGEPNTRTSTPTPTLARTEVHTHTEGVLSRTPSVSSISGVSRCSRASHTNYREMSVQEYLERRTPPASARKAKRDTHTDRDHEKEREYAHLNVAELETHWQLEALVQAKMNNATPPLPSSATANDNDNTKNENENNTVSEAPLPSSAITQRETETARVDVEHPLSLLTDECVNNDGVQTTVMALDTQHEAEQTHPSTHAEAEEEHGESTPVALSTDSMTISLFSPAPLAQETSSAVTTLNPNATTSRPLSAGRRNTGSAVNASANTGSARASMDKAQLRLLFGELPELGSHKWERSLRR